MAMGGMMKMRLIATKVIPVVAVLSIVMFGYNNCSSRHETIGEVNETASTKSGLCETQLMNTYSNTFWAFFKSQEACASCHVEGVAPPLASKDISMSYGTFKSYGLEKIASQAVSSHRVPYTGPVHQTKMEAFAKEWPQAETDYMDCQAKIEGGGIDESI